MEVKYLTMFYKDQNESFILRLICYQLAHFVKYLTEDQNKFILRPICYQLANYENFRIFMLSFPTLMLFYHYF